MEVYSNCKEVELFLNGQSLGVKKINADASPRIWRVAFAPGKIKAVARNDGTIVAEGRTHHRRQTGKTGFVHGNQKTFAELG